jgi:M6 family metalloprotease-like protein
MSISRTPSLFRTTALLMLLLPAAGIAADGRRSMQSVEGTLTVVWGDPAPGAASGGETRYSLALSDGTVIPLQLQGQENAALMNFGRRVTVTGLTSDTGALAVDTISDAKVGAGTVGTRKVLYLLLKYPDDADVPHPPTFYTNMNNPDLPPAGEVFPTTVNAFFKKTSWDQFSWIGDVAGAGGVGASGGWLTLPHPKSYYAPCGYETACASLNALSTDAMSLGRAEGIDFTNYGNINFVLSNDLDCCAWGGAYYDAFDNKVYGATWEPPWGQDTGTYSHEMGHSLGLPHSGWIYYAYDSPWDVMSSRQAATRVECGTYLSLNSGAPRTVYCPEPGDGYIAPHKDYLGWIPAANAVVTDTSASTTVTLEGGALPLGAGIKMLKVCIAGLPCDGDSGHYFTVEARVRDLGAASQYDNGLPNEGVIIHEVRKDAWPVGGSCFFNSQSGFAFPVDSTPGDYDAWTCSQGYRSYPNYALYNAQWSPGETYTNGFSISVVSRSGSNFVVSTTGKAPPTASAVNPATGVTMGGTNVTITGTNFVAGTIVAFGGVEASNTVVVNPTTITAMTPASAPGTVPVVVSNTLGQTATVPGGYLYSNVVSFTDSPLVANSTTIKRVHVTELRTRIDALRMKYGGLPAFPYSTDPTIAAGATSIKAQHIVEMRAALAPAYFNAKGTVATYATDPSLASGTAVKAAHVTELRTLVLSIE